MANELIKTEKNMVALAAERNLGDVIKPLTKEIHLFDSFISGTSRLEDKTVLDNLKPGDKLTLIREASKFDDNAIMILNADKKKLGYVPEQDDVVFARLMDAGKFLIAKVKDIDGKRGFVQVAIGIYMIDF